MTSTVPKSVRTYRRRRLSPPYFGEPPDEGPPFVPDLHYRPGEASCRFCRCPVSFGFKAHPLIYFVAVACTTFRDHRCVQSALYALKTGRLDW